MAEFDENITRIILVDDDPAEHEMFANALNELRIAHRLHFAPSIHSLFSLLEKEPLPHLIFLDIHMPHPDGLEGLHQLKGDERYKHIPAIMYSVSSREVEIEEAFGAGAHHYIVKPHVSVNLTTTLSHAFNRDWKQNVARPQRSDFVINIDYTGLQAS